VKTVWRVQNRYGEGPYRTRGKLAEVEWYGWQRDGEWPIPKEEGLPIRGYHCGFKDLKQLHAWFHPRELKFLAKFGFRPMRVRAHSIKIGKKQLVFKRDTYRKH
jgi:hypothetical protein